MIKETIKSIAVIGLGSLGGYIAYKLSELKDIKTIFLIDHDIVEYKNLKNSIYEKRHVNLYKTHCIKQLILENRNDILIHKINEKYYKSLNFLDNIDLILDCRDIICDRTEQINVRLFISLKFLIVDCRKNINYLFNSEGNYLEYFPTKEDLQNASYIMKDIIQNGYLLKLLEKELLISLNIKRNNMLTHPEISCTYEYVHDHLYLEDRFINIYENAKKIITFNTVYDLPIKLGNTIIGIIPKKKINNIKDLINVLCYTVSCKLKTSYNYYIVNLDTNFLELFPEVGGA